MPQVLSTPDNKMFRVELTLAEYVAFRVKAGEAITTILPPHTLSFRGLYVECVLIRDSDQAMFVRVLKEKQERPGEQHPIVMSAKVVMTWYSTGKLDYRLVPEIVP
jgi:hypothetical protein